MDAQDVQRLTDFARDVHPGRVVRELVWWGEDHMCVPRFELTPRAAKAADEMFTGALVDQIAPLLRAPFPRCEFLFPNGIVFGLWADGALDGSGYLLKYYSGSQKVGSRDLRVRTVEGGLSITSYETGANATPNERAAVGVFCKYLAFINCPKLLDTVVVDYAKQNRRLAKVGKPARAPRTQILPSALMIRYLDRDKGPPSGDTLEHPVRGHWRTVWCGPKNQLQRPEPRFIEPFMRGNPERGTKSASYLVKGNEDA